MIHNFPANIPQKTKSDLWHKQLCIKGISNIALISVKQLNSDNNNNNNKKKVTEKPELGRRKCEERWKVIQEDYLENPLKITPTYSVLFTIK